jgi:hypothetical protein
VLDGVSEQEVAMFEGQCLCGAVRYSILAPLEYAGYCHCAGCRALTGAAFCAFAGIAKEHVRVDRGEDQIAVYQRNPDNFVSRCKLCGSPLFALVRDGRYFHVQLGTVAGDPGIRPMFHIFVAEKAPWHVIADSLPQHDGLPP